MFTQSRDPNNKHKPAYKKYCSYFHRTKLSISACSKNNEMIKINEMLMLDRNPLKNHLYRTFVHPLTIEQKHTIHATEVEVRHELIILTKIHTHKTDIALSRDRFSYDKNTTPLQYTRSRYDNYKRDSRSYGSPYRSSYKSPCRHDSRHRYRSCSYSRDNNTCTRYTSSYRPPSRPRDSRYSRSRSHSNRRNKLITIQLQPQSDPVNFEVHMYHPTEMPNAVTPTSWFYFVYFHTPSTQIQRENPFRLEISFIWIVVLLYRY